MKRELPAGARVALLAASACLLFAAVATAGTWDDPYAPNEWVFSHVHLAELALERGEIPVNWRILTEHTLDDTHDAFRDATGLERMSFYATTIWHFWNGLPLHPALVATVSLLTGLAPESAVRIPMGGLLAVLLTYATASVLVAHSHLADRRLATVAPFLAAVACAPLALDLRVLMPSVALVAVLTFLHLMVRRSLARDPVALPLALAPLALVPFWYYTMAYFSILLFAGLLAAGALMRRAKDAGRAPMPAPVPLGVVVGVPSFLVAALLLNGALMSQLHLASFLAPTPRVTPGLPADYSSFLNRQTWRSGLLYLQLALLFAPFAFVALEGAARAWRRRPLGPARALFTAWALGGALFSALMVLAVGVSFLNRSAIYLAPVAALAATFLLARHWPRPLARRALAAGLAAAVAITPLLVATAAPTTGEADRAAFVWMEARVPHEAAVYASLEASSILFRAHGFLNVTSAQPTKPLLESLWYSQNPRNVAPHLSTSDYLVLRDDYRETGFEEFGPARSPISEGAYAKFLRTPALSLVYDNGGVQVFRVTATLDMDPPAA